ncbi:hypothetical protein [Yoonia sp. 2307UL14-13]|uniref:hypothetical protein n=1 Tax=Yoonia sp. 2307UL14-13 TaxID=3126506 RepID=UPI00309A9187
MPLTYKIIAVLAVIGLVLIAVFMRTGQSRPIDAARFDAFYAAPAPTTAGPLRVFHLGHSLVGRDMPAMLAQLAPDGHGYESQLGWGTPMRAHWEPSEPINGFDEENDHPRYRDAKEALASGEYDAFVLTEMVEIRDAIKYHDSPKYLSEWAMAAEMPVYLYESWHRLDDAEGWLTRLDKDLTRYWEDGVMRPALARMETPRPIYVIPAGQVMAKFVRAVEAHGDVAGISGRDDLFSDDIHFNDVGAYLVALTHYAVLYQQSPVGLPHVLKRADGTPADAPSAEAAALMQEIVWEVVQAYPRTGLPQG